jgi:tetratricopeptide (TPR) repeat protein
MQLVTLLMGEGDTEEARTHLVRVLELDSGHAAAHYHLADILYKERRLEEAADHYRQALHTQPDLYEAQASLGMILLETGKLDEAVEHLAEAVRLEPRSVLTSFYCGQALHRQGKLQEAMSCYQRAVEHNADFVPALLGLASIHVMVDRPELYDLDAALAHAEKACELTRRQDPDALKTLAAVYAVARRFDDAVNTAKSALEIARAAGDRRLADRIQKMLKVYEQLQAGKRE